jgi:hypothetical protein
MTQTNHFDAKKRADAKDAADRTAARTEPSAIFFFATGEKNAPDANASAAIPSP